MDDYSESLIKTIGGSEIGTLAEDYAKEGLEHVIDGLIDNEIAREIPIVKAVLGVGRGVLDIRDRNYLKKVFRFLFQTSKVSDDVKQKFSRKLQDNPKEIHKAGEAVWEILDSISSGQKATIIGKLFTAYMGDEITVDQLIYLSEMVDKAYGFDLENIETGKVVNRENLINIGVYEPIDVKKVIDDDFALTSRGLTSNPQRMQSTPLTPEGAILVRILRQAD